MTSSAKPDPRDEQLGRQGRRALSFDGGKRVAVRPVQPRGSSVRFVMAGVVLLLVGVFCLTAGAKLLIEVDHPTLEPMKIVLPDFASGPSGQVNGRELADILRNDLFLTGLFHFVEMPRSAVEPAQGEPDFQTLSQTGAQALILGSVIVEGDQ